MAGLVLGNLPVRSRIPRGFPCPRRHLGTVSGGLRPDGGLGSGPGEHPPVRPGRHDGPYAGERI